PSDLLVLAFKRQGLLVGLSQDEDVDLAILAYDRLPETDLGVDQEPSRSEIRVDVCGDQVPVVMLLHRVGSYGSASWTHNFPESSGRDYPGVLRQPSAGATLSDTRPSRCRSRRSAGSS